jgi:uncharacterized protein (DUF1330 family)
MSLTSLTIKDAVRFEDYKRTVMPSMEKYGGRFVARGGPIHVLEGEWLRERLIIDRVSQHETRATVAGFARIRGAEGAAPSHG